MSRAKAEPSNVKRPRYSYVYTDLDKLPTSGYANVYGVVKFVKEVRTTRSGDFFKLLGLHNEDLYIKGRKFVVTMFAKSLNNLPECSPGDILRFHRLKLEIYHGDVNGRLQIHAGGQWLLFDSLSADYTWKASSAADPSYEAVIENGIINSLRDWVKRDSPVDLPDAFAAEPSCHAPANETAQAVTAPTSSQNHCDVPLQSIMVDSYFSVKCQLLMRAILSTPGDENKMAILKVWDGTTPRIKLSNPSLDGLTVEHFCQSLDDVLSDYCVHIVVYGEHVKHARRLRLGEFYRFHDVHCKVYPRIGKPELYLHERFKRLACTISETDANKLKDELRGLLGRLRHQDLNVDPSSVHLIPMDELYGDINYDELCRSVPKMHLLSDQDIYTAHCLSHSDERHDAVKTRQFTDACKNRNFVIKGLLERLERNNAVLLELVSQTSEEANRRLLPVDDTSLMTEEEAAEVIETYKKERFYRFVSLLINLSEDERSRLETDLDAPLDDGLFISDYAEALKGVITPQEMSIILGV